LLTDLFRRNGFSQRGFPFAENIEFARRCVFHGTPPIVYAASCAAAENVELHKIPVLPRKQIVSSAASPAGQTPS
jgi:hypothetical protein